MSYHKLEIILANPENYKQCSYCKNPLLLESHSCPTCGGEYFVPTDKVDFSHLKNEIEDQKQEINV